MLKLLEILNYCLLQLQFIKIPQFKNAIKLLCTLVYANNFILFKIYVCITLNYLMYSVFI